MGRRRRRYYDDDDDDSSGGNHVSFVNGMPWGGGFPFEGGEGGPVYRHAGHVDGQWENGHMSRVPDGSHDPNSPGRRYARQLIERQAAARKRQFLTVLTIFAAIAVILALRGIRM